MVGFMVSFWSRVWRKLWWRLVESIVALRCHPLVFESLRWSLWWHFGHEFWAVCGGVRWSPLWGFVRVPLVLESTWWGSWCHFGHEFGAVYGGVWWSLLCCFVPSVGV